MPGTSKSSLLRRPGIVFGGSLACLDLAEGGGEPADESDTVGDTSYNTPSVPDSDDEYDPRSSPPEMHDIKAIAIYPASLPKTSIKFPGISTRIMGNEFGYPSNAPDLVKVNLIVGLEVGYASSILHPDNGFHLAGLAPLGKWPGLADVNWAKWATNTSKFSTAHHPAIPFNKITEYVKSGELPDFSRMLPPWLWK
jgi:hypothetical protein